MEVENEIADTGGTHMSGDNTNEKENEGTNDDIVPPVRIREYPMYHKGPYVVFVKQKSSSLMFVSIARKVNEMFKSNVKSIMKVNSSKMRIEMMNASCANRILQLPFLKDYRVYIPAEAVEIDGIVSISTELTENEIIEMGKGKFSYPGLPMVSVNHAHRYSKRVGEGVFEPLETIRVTFSGTAIPKWLCIYGILFPVRIYNPQLMSCKTCLGDHHTEKHCTNRNTCLKCKGNHMTSECKEENPWCSHCRESISHGEADECPALAEKTKKLISRARNRSKKSYADAVKACRTIPLRNAYESLSDDEGEEESTAEGCSFWDNFSKPKRQNIFPSSGATKTSDSKQKSKREGAKRPRSSSNERRHIEKLRIVETKNNKRFGETKMSRVEQPSYKHKNNFNVETVKEIINSLMSHFAIPPHLQVIISAFVFPLIDSWWPSFCSSMSEKSGREASSLKSKQDG
jgi:hypothetical protein